MRHVLAALAFTLFAAVVVADESPEELDRLLAASFGGQDEDDVPPAFGDPDLLTPAFQAADRRVFDRALPFSTRRGVVNVRIAIVWGFLAPHPDASEAIDWSGRIAVTNAGLRVLRRLTFEEPAVVLRPRTDVHVVEFESQTRPHADGLLLDVVLAPSLNPGGGPVTLTFDTPPYTETLVIEPGMRRSHIAQVDAAGHVAAYQIIRPDTRQCSEGIFRGLWRTTRTPDDREVGLLKARFATDDGRLQGHLRGVLGMRQNGRQSLFVLMMDNGGQFYSLIAGRYGDGKFAGLLLGRGHEVKGLVRGRYVDGDGDHDGGFIARYSERCGEDPREGDILTDDEPDVPLDDAP